MQVYIASAYKSLTGLKKNMINAVAKGWPKEKQGLKHYSVSSHTLFTGSGKTMKDKCFESIQNIKAAITVQLRILMKVDFQNWFRTAQQGWHKYIPSKEE